MTTQCLIYEELELHMQILLATINYYLLYTDRSPIPPIQ